MKVLRKLLDGLEGNLTSPQYARLARTSQHTTSRDIADLVAIRILNKGMPGVRSTHFMLV